MKNRLYLSMVIVALLCLALAGWTAHAQLQRGSAARQTWEYKTITISRTTISENWSSWSEDNKQLPLPVDGMAKRIELGNQGWELVAVVPIGGTVGGATTDMQQFYKRPK